MVNLSGEAVTNTQKRQEQLSELAVVIFRQFAVVCR